LLAKILAERRPEGPVDLDSDPNLANALGIAGRALVHRKDLVAERTGSTGETGNVHP
jgi:CO dehydrogenase nickel-insertion accessory protein CooC1